VQQHAVVLGNGAGAPDDVHHGRELAVGTREGVERRELADAEGRDDGGEAIDAAVAIGSVAWAIVQLDLGLGTWERWLLDTYQR